MIEADMQGVTETSAFTFAPTRLHARMIAFLRGLLAEALPHRATIDVNGVGYLILTPLTTFDKLPQPGEKVQLLTHYHVTDRDHTLFGFITSDERDLLRLFIDRGGG